MPEKRFYLPIPFTKNETVELPQEELQHLRVMRIKENDLIELVNGKNQLAIARLIHLEKKTAQLLLEEIIKKPPHSPKVILAQAITRPKNLELIIEKGTELGANAFWLFPGQRSDPKPLSAHQLKRLENHAISALKQCGRLDLPSIVLKPPLAEWEKPPGLLLFGDLSQSAPLLTPSKSDTTIFIGPEKGFSQEELDFITNQLGAKGIRLNSNILRAETAALASLAILTSLT